MLIGLDAIPLTELKTGVGHYTFELARALAQVAPENDFELAYPSNYLPIDLPGDAVAHSFHVSHEAGPLPLFNQDEIAPIPRSSRNKIGPTLYRNETTPSLQVSLNEGALRSLPNLKLARVKVGPLSRHWWSIGLPRYVRKRGIDLFHGTNYDVPLRKRCPTVLTVHDLSLFTHPETHRASSVRRARRRLPLMLRTATAIITPTDNVRREVNQQFGISTEKIFSAPEAARTVFTRQDHSETEFIRRRLGINHRFILSVGTLEPRKNLRTLVKAFEIASQSSPEPDLQLVVAGGKGWLTDQIFAEVERSPIKDKILFAGYLNDDELRALYSSCLLFVYPSLDEGFGLPLLEAMQCGAPVVASRIPSLSEVAGDAAVLVDPNSTEDIAAAIVKLFGDKQERRLLSQAGLNRAAGFSWERTAQLTLEVYRVALDRFAKDRS